MDYNKGYKVFGIGALVFLALVIVGSLLSIEELSMLSVFFFVICLFLLMILGLIEVATTKKMSDGKKLIWIIFI